MINKFKKDEYIVFTKGLSSSSFPLNYIFKQRQDKDHLSVYEDATGDENDWEWHRNFNKLYLPDGRTKPIITDWRYATVEEIDEYNRLGKPYDVTTLNKPKESLKKAVHLKTQEEIEFFREKLSINPIKTDIFEIYGEIAYYLNSPKTFDVIDLVKQTNYQIISFEDWCKQNNYVMKTKFEFKVGNWYKTKEGYYGKLMLKNESYEYPNQFPGLEYINPNGKYKTIGTYFQIDSIIQQEIDLSEIQQYLPDGHVDKIVEEIDLTGRYLKALIDSPQSTSYKKDDFVKIITKKSNCRYEIGDNKINSWIYSTNNGTQHHWELMPIGFEPPVKDYEFKVGDYVEIIANTLCSCNKVGDIGIITEMGAANDCRVECGSTEPGNWSYLKELKLSSLEAYSAKYNILINDLLEEAKRRYPKGTKFHPVSSLTKNISKNFIFTTRDDNFTVHDGSIICNTGNLYVDGVWAEIVEKPKSTPSIPDCPFNEGDLVSCNIHSTYVEGKIHFENNIIFICQNSRDGAACKDKLGYNYSWMIYSISSPLPFENQLISHNVGSLQLLNESKSSDSLDDEYNEIFSGKGIIDQIKSKPATYSESFTSKNLEKVISDIKVSITLKKTETPKIELLKTTKI